MCECIYSPSVESSISKQESQLPNYPTWLYLHLLKHKTRPYSSALLATVSI